MTAPLHIASYNIHKGLSQFNRRLTVHDLRDRLGTLGSDIVFLQEVQGSHGLRASRFQNWPNRPQHEFLAGQIYTDFAYGKNCVYDTGHHGNAILSRYKILSWENEDISAHSFESRGMLHCEIEVPGMAIAGALHQRAPGADRTRAQAPAGDDRGAGAQVGAGQRAADSGGRLQRLADARLPLLQG